MSQYIQISMSSSPTERANQLNISMFIFPSPLYQPQYYIQIYREMDTPTSLSHRQPILCRDSGSLGAVSICDQSPGSGCRLRALAAGFDMRGTSRDCKAARGGERGRSGGGGWVPFVVELRARGHSDMTVAQRLGAPGLSPPKSTLREKEGFK